MTVYETALSYASAGIYVNPVYVQRGPDGKKQVRPVGRWREMSTISKADIYAWWGPGQPHEHAGILIDCGKSNLVVVDPDGPDGVATWLELFDGVPPIPLGVVNTPMGGQHWYYWAHPDHPIGNDQDGKVAPKVDVRGLGGLAIAPPTRDGTGTWEWVTPPQWHVEHVVPDLVIERMTARKAAPAPAVPAPGDDLFDDSQREFTEQQAIAFVKAARVRLAQTTQGFNGAINNFAMACAHFPWRVDRELCAKLMIETLKPITGWTEPDLQDRMTINSAYAATEAGRSWVAVKVDAPAGQGGAASLDVLPPPGDPHRVARELLSQMDSTGGVLHRAWWRGDFYEWTGAHWDVQELPVMERWLYRQTADAVYLVPGKDGGFERRPWAPTRPKVSHLVHALGVSHLQRLGDEDRVLAPRNGVVDPRTRELMPHTPRIFNLFSLPFDFDPQAGAPGWEAFLEQVLPGDQQAKDFLAEWFGYVLSGRTDQQKMAALIGGRRSGKGTIARVLGAMVGKENVAGLNLNLLPGTFGLEPLVGAALAVAGDVRWHSRSIADAVPILLGVIGEDAMSVNRKNTTAWRGTLGTRFMLMSNETPTFSDRSGALGGRMIFVKFDQSFYGREDISLTDKLLGELPGILNWALDGLERLNGRGRFSAPDSGLAEAEAVRRLSDPIGAFLEDWCEVGPEHEISLDHLYLKYQNWCEGEGRTRDSTTKEVFSRDVRAKVPGLVVDRTRVQGKRVRMIKGLGTSVV